MPDAIRKVGEWLAHLWEWSTHDAVAFYTLWLAIFTGSLVWVSTVQIRYLRRADETARRSADAAKLAAETAHEEFVANHRPRIQILSFEESDIGAGGDEEQIKLGASLRYVNSGDTTAYLLEIGWHISYADHPLRPGVSMRTHDCCNQALQSGEEGRVGD